MKPFHFEIEYHEGLHVFRYLSGVSRMVERNWPGLAQDWPEHPTPYSEFNVNNNNCEEMAIYLGYAWRLTEGLCRYGIPSAGRPNLQPIGAVQWIYHTAIEQEGVAKDKGFIPTFPHVPSDVRRLSVGGSGQIGAPTAVFSLNKFEELVLMQRPTLSNAESQINLFGLRPGREQLLLQLLQGKKQPQLVDVLERGEIFIDIVVGIDRGYYDSILIESPTDISENVKGLVQEYEKAIIEYESAVAEIRGVREFLQVLRSLSFGRNLRNK